MRGGRGGRISCSVYVRLRRVERFRGSEVEGGVGEIQGGGGRGGGRPHRRACKRRLYTVYGVHTD
jgi:hypothetical protein